MDAGTSHCLLLDGPHQLGQDVMATPSHLICPDDPPSALTERSHSESVAHRSGNNKLGWPGTGPVPSNNQLKLSVGGETDEDEEDLVDDRKDAMGQLRENMKQWHIQCGPSRNDFSDDFDVDNGLSSDRIRAIIQGDNLLFEPLQPGNFVEEVFSEKRPKIHNGYLFGDIIGEGSYAKVKEVVEQYSLVRRAVKIIKGTRLRKIPNGAENVEREIKILRKINHHNVIRLIDVFRNEQKKKLYLVMEFCMGSVQQLIDSSPSKRLPEAEAHSYFNQLMLGLEYLHSLGIVHKDIKPGNLLLSPEFVLKISDFGVAEELPLFQADDTCQQVQGTPKFQAPELVSGTTATFKGFKSDVWSCGVTLFNMISGEYPFEGEVIMRLFDNIAKQPLNMPTNVVVEEWLEKLLRGTMEKNPDVRWPIDSIKQCDWFMKTFSKESEHSPFPDRKQSVYRPLTVCRALEQLYGTIPEDRIVVPNDLDETMRSSREGVLKHVGNNGQQGGGDQEAVPNVAPEPRPKRNRSFLSCLRPNQSP